MRTADPCICGNLNKDKNPVSYGLCCGDKLEEGKLYYDKSLSDRINANFQLLDPFFTTNPAFDKSLEFKVNANFTFTVVSTDMQEFLFNKRIPVYNPRSKLSFHHLKINRYLPKEVDKERLFELFYEILHNEVQISIGSSLYSGFEVNRHNIENGLLTNAKQFSELYHREMGIVRLPEEVKKGITSINHMKMRWILDDCVIRIRSQWDKLLYLLSKGYFGIKINAKELKYNLNSGKIGELRTKAKIRNENQQQFFNAFCDLLLQIKDLKEYRDNLTHTVSAKIQNCLGFYDEKVIRTIDDLFNLVKNEHKRVQEGIMTVIGVFIC